MTKRLISAAILGPSVLAAIFFLPSWLFVLCVSLILFLASLELLKLLERYSARAYAVIFPLALALPWIWTQHPQWLVHYGLVCFILLISWCVFRTRDLEAAFPSLSGNLLVLVYVALPIAIVAVLQQSQKWELFFVLAIVWGGDTGAFFTGRAWGRHKITPRISPNKSLEGYVSGILVSVVAAVFIGTYMIPGKSHAYLLISGFCLGLAGILGDLFESILKRGAGVKDSSNMIPGHGGVLDRIDSLLFAFPAYYLISLLLE